MTARFTDTQGQYLAFIHTYSKLHLLSPPETDFQSYFQSPPTAHPMIVTLTIALIQHPPQALTI